jgi:copper(I)-binding protein
MLLRPLVFAGFLLFAAAVTHAEDRVGDIHILAAWARATPGPTAAVYLDLRNEGSEPDRLTGASTQLAERIELHEHRSSAGVMSMAAAPEIVLPPHTTVRLAPGKVHLMLFGLGRPLKPADRFSVTLRFERAGEVEVEAVTGGAGAIEAPHDHD